MSRKKLDEAISAALNEQEQLDPPWVRFPGMSRYAMGWRMGEAEHYLKMWRRWAESRSLDWRVYFKSHEPIPHSWAVWPLEMLGEDDGIDELEESEIANRARSLGFEVSDQG